jgi:hypothetical protein
LNSGIRWKIQWSGDKIFELCAKTSEIFHCQEIYSTKSLKKDNNWLCTFYYLHKVSTLRMVTKTGREMWYIGIKKQFLCHRVNVNKSRFPISNLALLLGIMYEIRLWTRLNDCRSAILKSTSNTKWQAINCRQYGGK